MDELEELIAEYRDEPTSDDEPQKLVENLNRDKTPTVEERLRGLEKENRKSQRTIKKLEKIIETLPYREERLRDRMTAMNQKVSRHMYMTEDELGEKYKLNELRRNRNLLEFRNGINDQNMRIDEVELMIDQLMEFAKKHLDYTEPE